MSSAVDERTAAELRDEFDASFAEAVVRSTERHEELLAIRAHERHLAIRARQIAEIVRCPPLTAMPSRSPALCGIGGVRGTLVCVYSIASLLGGTARDSGSGWVVLCADDRSVALHFDELVGYVRVRSGDIHSGPAPSQEARSEVVRAGGVQRNVLSVPSLLNHIHEAASLGKERD